MAAKSPVSYAPLLDAENQPGGTTIAVSRGIFPKKGTGPWSDIPIKTRLNDSKEKDLILRKLKITEWGFQYPEDLLREVISPTSADLTADSIES